MPRIEAGSSAEPTRKLSNAVYGPGASTQKVGTPSTSVAVIGNDIRPPLQGA